MKPGTAVRRIRMDRFTQLSRSARCLREPLFTRIFSAGVFHRNGSWRGASGGAFCFLQGLSEVGDEVFGVLDAD